LTVTNFIMTVYYYIYLYFEDTNINISYFYLKKSLVYMEEMIPYYRPLLFNRVLDCDFMYNPTVEAMVHKTCQVLLSLVIKFMSDEMDHAKHGNGNELRMNNDKAKLIAVLNKKYNALVDLLETLSTRYYYSWKITKGHKFFRACLEDEGFLKRISEDRRQGVYKFNEYQIRELLSVVTGGENEFNEESTKVIPQEKVKEKEKEKDMEHENVSVDKIIQIEDEGNNNNNTNTNDEQPQSGQIEEEAYNYNLEEPWLELLFNVEQQQQGGVSMSPRDLTLFDIYDEFNNI